MKTEPVVGDLEAFLQYRADNGLAARRGIVRTYVAQAMAISPAAADLVPLSDVNPYTVAAANHPELVLERQRREPPEKFQERAKKSLREAAPAFFAAMDLAVKVPSFIKQQGSTMARVAALPKAAPQIEPLTGARFEPAGDRPTLREFIQVLRTPPFEKARRATVHKSLITRIQEVFDRQFGLEWHELPLDPDRVRQLLTLPAGAGGHDTRKAWAFYLVNKDSLQGPAVEPELPDLTRAAPSQPNVDGQEQGIA